MNFLIGLVVILFSPIWFPLFLLLMLFDFLFFEVSGIGRDTRNWFADRVAAAKKINEKRRKI